MEPRRRDPAPREDQYGNREEKQRNAREVQRPFQNQETVKEIHTISGGIASGRESNSARKTYAKSMQGEEVESVMLSFLEGVAWGVVMPHNDALVVTVMVANHVIYWILIDNGSFTDIFYWPAFQQMGIDRDKIKPYSSPLIEFGRKQIYLVGIIPLPVTARTTPRLSTVMVDFLVVDRLSAYNAIICQPGLNKLRATTLTNHLMMKFPTEEGAGEIKGD